MTSIRNLRTKLQEETGCAAQHGGFPCNTCFHNMELKGISDKKLHELWEAVLVFRGDYTNKGNPKADNYIPITDKQVEERITKLYNALMKNMYRKINKT